MIHVFSLNALLDSADAFLYLFGGILLALFLGVGIWSLHGRFHRQEEWGVGRQLVLLGAVIVFCSLEIMTLRELMDDDIVLFIFSLLGLLVSGMALYGHLVISLLSRLLVELILPDHPATRDQPRLMPAEKLEKQGNWQGALEEYLILAHMYPGHGVVLSRITRNLIHQKRFMEALHWFERLIKHARRAEEASELLKQLITVFTEQRDLPSLRNTILLFLQRFPRETEIRSYLDGLEDDAAARLLPLEGAFAPSSVTSRPDFSAGQRELPAGLTPLAGLRESSEKEEALRKREEIEEAPLSTLRPLDEHPLKAQK